MAARQSKVSNSSVTTQDDDDSLYEEHLQNGIRALQTEDLDKAEQSFASALRSVHGKGKGQHKKELEAEPLYRLSDVYLKRGVQSKEGGDFTKAAALCNAALVRAGREGAEESIQEITQLFVKEVLKIKQKVDNDDTVKHKSMLKADRGDVETEIKRIDEDPRLDPYSLDEEDPEIKEVEMKRVEAIKTLFQALVGKRNMFIAGLVDECIKVMGPPPCKYAMIGMGSQATGLVTPYSDLEFAILVEEETEHNVTYFRNLTNYLHLKVINLGETILPAMGIKSLNDFYSDDPLDNWFYDSVTPRGFAFDGAMPHACKTPLGRGRNSTGTSELIRTPSNMTNILKDDLTFHLKKGYHLAIILGNVTFITGEQGLVELKAEVFKRLCDFQNFKTYAEQTLDNYLSKHGKYTVDGNVINLLNHLGIAWRNLGDYRKAVSYYEQSLQMCWSIYGEDSEHSDIFTSLNNLGEAWTKLGDYRKAISYHEQSLQMVKSIYGEDTEHSDIALSLKNLGWAWSNLGDNRKAVSYYEQSLQMERSVYGEGTEHSDIAASLNNLGNAWSDLGDYRKAVSYFEQSLQMRRGIYGEGTEHSYIAASLNNLGTAWGNLGDYRKAVSYFEQSLQMRRGIYGESTEHSDIAASLNNLGEAWINLGDYRKAVSYHEQSLQMRRSIYGEGTEDSNIAASLNNLGTAWCILGDYRKAVSYFEQSLQMKLSIYGKDSAHPDIAASLNNLGSAWRALGDNKKAIEYLHMKKQMEQMIGSSAE
ncbi:hypothetical protein Bbelb_230370 [Branchiostoma belcheri]|nr:hypothetical protein Bbelb_230370 [Branchiostoma belcheri]